ncbi:group II intron reverse transcriptase/maturase [Sedimentibacter sp.]|uniref:group II intron reverse transcriptase/maturase n=1 Tax=Sedimentibacter sp. TaxID=1960295 RepID=UPI00289A5A2E|nr:group II intron reverse transcriptase/maturase [Sedimentibacter sp.]
MQNDWSRLEEISKKYNTVSGLMSYVNADTLMTEFKRQSGKKAKGIDGISKTEYEEKLKENLENLVERLKAFSYHPKPVRRTYIPKDNGKVRPLGIPSFEDKLVQGAMAKALESVYEHRFLNCSYGFRKGKNAHQCIGDMNHTLMFRKVNYVLDADIKGFFDNVEHNWLIKFLEHDIADKTYIRYIKRLLRVGVMEEGKHYETDKNVPQGGVISPTLANVYLHYVLDLWLEKRIKQNLRGEAYLYRYADDFAIMFQYEDDSKKIYQALIDRFAKFGLELAIDKTRIVPFGRYKGTKESFDFLGFRFINGRDREGSYRVHIRTSKKKLNLKRQIAKEWLTERMHKPIWQTLETLKLKLNGHVNYYGVNGNLRSVQNFFNYVKYTFYRVLRRRGQKKPIKFKDFIRIWDAAGFKPPKVCVNIWY